MEQHLFSGNYHLKICHCECCLTRNLPRTLYLVIWRLVKDLKFRLHDSKYKKDKPITWKSIIYADVRPYPQPISSCPLGSPWNVHKMCGCRRTLAHLVPFPHFRSFAYVSCCWGFHAFLPSLCQLLWQASNFLRFLHTLSVSHKVMARPIYTPLDNGTTSS